MRKGFGHVMNCLNTPHRHLNLSALVVGIFPSMMAAMDPATPNYQTNSIAIDPSLSS